MWCCTEVLPFPVAGSAVRVVTTSRHRRPPLKASESIQHETAASLRCIERAYDWRRLC